MYELFFYVKSQFCCVFDRELFKTSEVLVKLYIVNLLFKVYQSYFTNFLVILLINFVYELIL